MAIFKKGDKKMKQYRFIFDDGTRIMIDAETLGYACNIFIEAGYEFDEIIKITHREAQQ
jgi:hypothetical protein